MTKCEPGSMGMRTAWSRTDEALEALGALLKNEQALPLVETVTARLLKLRRA
jgi:hypothetical protein